MKRNYMFLSVVLAACGFMASCADDDSIEGTGGNNNGLSVRFRVGDVQNDAQTVTTRAVAGDNTISTAAFREHLAMQGLTFNDLTTQQLPVEGANDLCLAENTVAGVNPVEQPKVQTRGNLVTSITENFSSLGYRGTDASNISATHWFHNMETDKMGVLQKEVKWNQSQPFAKFYGVFPQVTDGYSKLTLSAEGYAGTPYVDFEVEPDAKNQKDLLTACSGVVQFMEPFEVAPEAKLRFRHALTAVNFKVGQNLSWGKIITKVEIMNAKSKGRYTLPTDENGTGAVWTDLSAPTTFTLDGLEVSTSGAANTILTGTGKRGDNYTFFMIPQSLDGVKVVFTFSDNSTITAALKGTWKAGTTKTYALSEKESDWEYFLEVTEPYAAEYYETETWNNYSVRSVRMDPSTFTNQPVAWKVVGYEESTDGGSSFGPLTTTKPAWLTGLTLEGGVGGVDAQEGKATFTKDVNDLLAIYNKEMQDATQKGSSGNFYNLSNRTGAATVENTANSYLISAPGYYKIPLVYGNAIKNGSKNEKSYKTANTGDNILSTFKDHDGQNITDPWITLTNGGVNAPDGAKIVWTDQSGIVEESSLGIEGTGSNAFVHFRVPKSNLKNGNAVIAVTKGGTVVWSWHLWFAKEDVLNAIPVTNFQKVDYKFSKMPLGFAYRMLEGSTYDKPRVVRVKVEQTISNRGEKKFAYIKLTQNPGSFKEVSATYYQFGRKDAMPGVKTVSDGAIIENGGNNMSIQNGIQHPETFYTGGSSWKTVYCQQNLWSMDNTTSTNNDNPVVKTIYDPCPAGFKMPASNAFTGCTKTGRFAKRANYNIVGNWEDGWNFPTKTGSSEPTIFFHALGQRTQSSGAIFQMNQAEAYYWTAIPITQYACCLHFTEFEIDPLHDLPRSYGFNVRPVTE